MHSTTIDQNLTSAILNEIDSVMMDGISTDEEEMVKQFIPVPINAPARLNEITLPQMRLLWGQIRKRVPRIEPFGEFSELSKYQQEARRLTAYWEIKGASDSRVAAISQGLHADSYVSAIAFRMTATIVESRLLRKLGDLTPPPDVWVPLYSKRVTFSITPCDRLLLKSDAYIWAPEIVNQVLKTFNVPTLAPDIRKILDRCPQMAMIHALRGNVTEPYWWAALSITEHATPNYSRQCSDGYPGFSDEELGQRVERIRREKTKPALCTRLDSVNRGVCNVCRFRGVVRSPIALGYEHEPKRKSGVAS